MGEQNSSRPAGTVGPYRLERLLGTGGMGAVYLGRHEGTGALAAVKLIRPEFADDPPFRARLRREIAAARRVPRFCTAALLDADPDAEPPWIATEYVDAPTLDVALLASGPLTGGDLDAFAVGVAVALRAIHQHGVIHRDLKPSNVLMSRLGPRVIDFGIARPADPDAQLTRLTYTGVVIGTPAYMAPEQLAGAPVTSAVDVYAWASLVAYAATGRSAVARNATGPAGPSAVPEPLLSLVNAALAADPAARPSAAALVERLTRRAVTVTTQVLATDTTPIPDGAGAVTIPDGAGAATIPDGHRPSATAVGIPPEGFRGRGRARWRRVSAAAAAAVLVVAVVAGAIRFWPSGPSPDDASPSVTAPPFGALITQLVTGKAEGVTSVAVGDLDGVPIAVSGSHDYTARIWNLVTGKQVGRPLAGHTGAVYGVAIGELGNDTVAVTAGRDGTARVWDLATGRQRGRPLTGHTGLLHAVAIGKIDGEPVAVTGGLDRTVRVWDVATGTQRGRALTGHTDGVRTVAVGELNGVPVAVSGGDDGFVRVWDLLTGRQIRQHATGTDGVVSVALADLDGEVVAVTSVYDGDVLQVIDLTPGGRQLDRVLLHGQTNVFAVAVTKLNNMAVGVAGAGPSTGVWNLATGEPVGQRVFGHRATIEAVAVGELNNSPIAVTGAANGTIRVWSLAPPRS